MALNPNWPLMATQAAFNSGFATLGPLVWTDLTSRQWSLGCDRGRQYELDLNQAGTARLVLADKDELLNPANPNPGYPYAGCVLPYRPILVQAQWPPAPVGAAVNLLNSASQAPGPYDPSFESYTAGATVPWISAVGATAPVVGTTTPHAGSNDVAWAVANGTTVQGVAYQVPCIPGQQYTSSVYVRQSSASTQGLRVTDQNLVIDAFGRTTTNGWGTADLGGAWANSGGSAGDYSTAANIAYHSNAAVNTVHETVVGASIADSDQRVTITVPVVATGAEIDAGLVARWADANNHYFAELRFNTDQTIGVRIQRIVAGTITSIATATLGFQYLAGTALYLRFQTTGPVVQAKAWLFGTAEPATWTVTATDTNITAAGAVGCRSVLAAGNTNGLPVAMSFGAYSAVGSVVGSTTTTTGSYVRLTATWTATQPLHTVQVATSGTAVAGTVLLDDVQHEPGASASTATTSGPVIYGVHRGYVERWPSTWNHRGMYGYAQITAVDGYAAFAARLLHTEYANAVLAKSPDFYWRLNEAQGATTFAESSGHGGVSLVRTDSKYGAAPTFAAGTAMAIAGDPASTGLAIARPPGVPTIPGPTSVVQTGFPAANGFTWTVGGGFPWGLTSAVWAKRTALSTTNVYFMGVQSATNVNLSPLSWNIGPNPGGYVQFSGSPDGVHVYSAATAADTWDDGLPHLYVGTLSATGGGYTANLYIDGVLAATASGSTAGWSAIPQTATQVQLGSTLYTNSLASYPNIPGAAYAHPALWARTLSAGEIADLWAAGKGYAGEQSGARIARYLGYANTTAPSSVDAGQSVMGADVLAEGTALLAASQAVATSENGNFWVTGTGTATFTSRTRRYLTTTVKWVFGEQESPYLDDIGFDFDPQLVVNEVTVTNAGGAAPRVVDPTSQGTYGPRSLQRNINVRDNNEATDAANWILFSHKAPHQRIARLTIDPASNPSLWPVALGVEIGDRVTVNRRTAAFTMTADYFIERIAHNQDPSSWTVQLEMSPASLWPTPWLLDSATYSVLGSTTVLGY